MNKNLNKFMIIATSSLVLVGVILTNKNTSTESDVNKVLESWNSTQAPMPIPIPVYEDDKEVILEPFLHHDSGLFGYKCPNNEIAIRPTFTKAGMFYSGLAPVQLSEKGKIGFINTKGELVKEPFIDYIERVYFKREIMIVRINDKYGAISFDAETILDVNYSSAEKVLTKLNLE